MSMRAEDPFVLACTVPALGSETDLSRADQLAQATEGYAEAPFSMINPLAFPQSRSVHDHAAQVLPDISPLAFNQS